MKLELEKRRLDFEEIRAGNEDKFEQFRTQMEANIEVSKNNQQAQMDNINAQIEQFKVSVDSQNKQAKIASDAEAARAKLEKEYQQINSDILLAREELSLKRDELIVELRKIADKKEVEQFSLMIDARVAGFEEKLQTAELELKKTQGDLDLQERFITEQRLQAEHQIELGHSKIESLEKVIDVALKKKELDAPLEMPKVDEAPKKKKRVVSDVQRDKSGNIARIIRSEED
jgi:hypothetical protein